VKILIMGGTGTLGRRVSLMSLERMRFWPLVEAVGICARYTFERSDRARISRSGKAGCPWAWTPFSI